jgi:hypothetical protein
MSPLTLETLRCPVSGHRLFDAFWVATAVEIRIKCTCGRLVQVTRDFHTEVIQDRPIPKLG